MEWGKRVFLLLEYQCVKEAGDSPRRREELYKFFFVPLFLIGTTWRTLQH